MTEASYPTTYAYSLIVKDACEHRAAERVQAEIPDATALSTTPTSVGSQHVVSITATRDLGLPLNQWVVRDHEAPFPLGSLLYWHEHDEGDECECAQYVTDHHPYASWNTDPAPVPTDVCVAWETGDDTRVTWWPGSSTFHVETRYDSWSTWSESDVFTRYGDAQGTPPTLEQAAEAARSYLTSVSE